MSLTSRRPTLAAFAGLAVSALVSFSAPAFAAADDAENDPFETVNRGIFEFNSVADEFVIEPVAKGYRYVAPEPVRSRLSNASDNLNEPLNMINSFLQGDFQHGMVSFWRFLINSTVGIAGLNDVAGSAGLQYRKEDFGQTFATWGAGEGPYLVIPILGPSNVRDFSGTAISWFADPVNLTIDDTSTEIWLAVGRGVIQRERLIEVYDDVEENSLDPYATFRSMYHQHREAQISNTGEGPLAPVDAKQE